MEETAEGRVAPEAMVAGLVLREATGTVMQMVVVAAERAAMADSVAEQ